jgi:NAD(P)H-dependent FMN reductase
MSKYKMERMKNVLIWVGSNSSSSINKSLAAYTAGLIHANTTLVSMKDLDFPMYNPDLEKEEGIPKAVKSFYDKILETDGLVIASPEHNGLMPAVFKNATDWLSRINMRYLNDKPILLLSTSPGKNGGKNNLDVLSRLLPFAGAIITGQYSLGNFNDQFNSGSLQNESEIAKLQSTISAFENMKLKAA